MKKPKKPIDQIIRCGEFFHDLARVTECENGQPIVVIAGIGGFNRRVVKSLIKWLKDFLVYEDAWSNGSKK